MEEFTMEISEKEVQDLKQALADLTGKLDTSEKEMKAIKVELEAVKALPAQSPLPKVRAHEKYMGYDLSKQGLELKTKDEETKDRVSKWLISVINASMRVPRITAESQDYLQKANTLTEADATYAGYLVPDEYTMEVLSFARQASFALANCRIFPMSEMIRRVPAENALVSVAWTSEGSAATQTNPTVAEVVLTAKKLDAFGIMSLELMQDAQIDIVSWMTGQFGEALGLELDNQCLNGTGSPCSGILSAAVSYSVVMAGTAFSSITGDDLSNMIAQLPINRLAGAKFVLHRTPLHYIRTGKASTSGVYQWGQMASGDAPSIWGYNYIVSEKSPGTTGAATPFIVFGDLRNFILGRRFAPITLDLDPYTYFKESKVQFRIVNRWAAQIGMAGAFCRLLTHA